MIINILSKGQPPYETRPLLFEFNREYAVQLKKIQAVSKFEIEPGLYEITIDIIRREDGNPHRILDTVLIDKPTHFFNYTPTQSNEYKLSRYEINSLDLKILSKGTHEINFQEIYISFEVRETYGRF